MNTRASGEYYDVIAKYWDLMYAKESFYENGFKFIDALRKKHNLSKEILDVACGTGYLLTFFKKAGYKIYASDLSLKMVSITRKRLPQANVKKASFQKITFNKTFPLIVSFFNSFDYCTTTKELINALAHLKNQLSPKGFLIFDLFVTDKPAEVFGIKSWSFGNVHISRTMYGYPKAGKFYSEMIYNIIENKKSKIVNEKTVRGIFSRKDVLQSIKNAGLNNTCVGHGYFETGGITTFVAERKEK